MKILNISLDNLVLDKSSKTANRVKDYGFSVDKYTVVVPSKIDSIFDLSSGVKVYGAGGANKVIRFVKIYSLAGKLLSSGNYDLITSQDAYFLGLLSLILARRYKVGFEVQVHGWEKFWGLRKIITKYTVKHADAVRVVSQRLKEQLMNEFGIKEEGITVVPIFTDLSLRGANESASRRRNERRGILGNKLTNEIALPSACNDKFIFLTVGRLAPVKNIRMQIKAIKNLEFRIKNLELWIVGDGALKKKLKAQSSKFKADIKFLGWRDNLDELYAQADVFLLTSDYEGWGLAVVEAASYGLPIIMTDVGCADEVIKDRESGIIIPVGNQKKLEEAMVMLAKDESLRKKLGNNAQEAVKKLPGKEKILDLYKQSWEKAIKNTEL